MSPDQDRIDEYLDRLLEGLRGSGRARRRALAETEDHLREAAAELRSRGATEDDAQREAIERFGPAPLVARRLAGEVGVPLLARPALFVLRLAAIGFTAIGVSGLIAGAAALVLGPSFAVGQPGAGAGPADYCAELARQDPGAGTCAVAIQHAWLTSELQFRLIVGAVGLALLGGLWLASRRWRDGRFRPLTVPVALVFAGGSLVVATSLGGQALDELSMGPGQELGIHLAGVAAALSMTGICAVFIRRRNRGGGEVVYW